MLTEEAELVRYLAESYLFDGVVTAKIAAEGSIVNLDVSRLSCRFDYILTRASEPFGSV